MTYNPQTQRWEGNETSIMNWENPSTHTLPGLPTHRENHNHHHHNNSIPTNLALAPPDDHTRKRSNASPPRPALITHVSSTTTSLGVRVERGMVFDPERMRWLKLDPRADLAGGRASLVLSEEGEEEDPFAGLADLEDERVEEEKENFGGVDEWGVGEEFDVGPGFVKRQKTEEGEWRRRVELWMVEGRECAGVEWKWAIREVAREYSGGHSGR